MAYCFYQYWLMLFTKLSTDNVDNWAADFGPAESYTSDANVSMCILLDNTVELVQYRLLKSNLCCREIFIVELQAFLS